MEQEWGSPKFVQYYFKQWYSINNQIIQPPTDQVHREFAFLGFTGRGMHRHIKLSTPSELQRYLRQNSPAHSFHSSSYYEFPDADMAKKGWLGADLVFDIDADHFELSCQKNHDKWRCINCDKQNLGKPPEICECGRAQFETQSWLCDNCLQAAKYETQKLIDILIQDMGFTPNDLTVNFSGNRGYHVHVKTPKIKDLDQNARREIVDYIMAIGLEPEYHGFSTPKRGSSTTLSSKGWRARTGKALYDYISECSNDDIKELKLSRKTTNNIINGKDKILQILVQKHPSQLLPLIDRKSLKIITSKAIKFQASSIDSVVTTDINRLIRLQNTLHGKSGWQVQQIPFGSLSDYDPMVSAVCIKGPPVKLRFRWAPKIKINNSEYGPYENEVAELPLEAALFFLAKKGAMVLE
jgi:DNA primase small subunit